MLNEFITEYGTSIMYTMVTAVFGFIGIAIKNVYQKYVNDKTKEKIVMTVVKAVKQLYSEMSGEEKLDKAIENISIMLAEKGISATELEIRMMIESAVLEIKEQMKEVK